MQGGSRWHRYNSLSSTLIKTTRHFTFPKCPSQTSKFQSYPQISTPLRIKHKFLLLHHSLHFSSSNSAVRSLINGSDSPTPQNLRSHLRLRFSSHPRTRNQPELMDKHRHFIRFRHGYFLREHLSIRKREIGRRVKDSYIGV